MAKNIEGICRVCGTHGKLTVEHILPRAAGGDEKTKIFTGDEFIKAVTRKKDAPEDEDEKPYGVIKQNGFTDFTLCKSCNSYSGRHYDKEFSDFYNAVRYFVHQQTKGFQFSTSDEMDEYLSDKGLTMNLATLKPNNIAKRILVAFCSVDHPGLTDRNVEIRRTIMTKEYQPDASGFSIYFTPHVGNNGYFGTLAALDEDGIVHSYAGLEIGPLSFYLSDHDAHLKGGGLARCIDITSWLTDYTFNEEADQLVISANFERSLGLSIPSWAFQ